MSRSRTVAFAAIALAVAPSYLSAQATLLRLQPEVGLSTTYQTENRMFMEMPMMPPSADGGPTMVQRVVTTARVTGAEADRYHFDVTVDDFSVDFPAMPQAAGMVPNMAGMHMTMTVDDRGQMVDQAIDMETVPAQLRSSVEGLSETIVSLGQMKLPADPVSPGDDWSMSTESTSSLGPGMSMEMNMQMTYVLQRVTNEGGIRLAHVGVDGVVNQSTTPGGQADVRMSGTIVGTAVIDLTRGRIHSMNTTTEVSGQMSMQGQSSPMSMTTESAMTIVE